MIERKVENLKGTVEELQSQINDNSDKFKKESQEAGSSQILRDEERIAVKRSQREAEKEVYYQSIHCDQCLREQRKQKSVDEHTCNEKTMTNVIHQLVCEYCKHEDFAVDGELQICRYCGTIKEEVSTEGDYGNYSVRHK